MMILVNAEEKILTMLRQARQSNENDGYVSGEMIADELHVTRAAIWKKVHALCQLGYEIESRSKRGYLLKKTPDLLLPYEIAPLLEQKNIQSIGKKIVYFDKTASTNEEAKKLARDEDAPSGTLVIAEEQSKGKGRLSRGWFSPPEKGIFFSIILRPNILPQDAPKCTLLAAVAVAKAMKQLGADVGIKWPNDILSRKDNKKLVGILTEMHAQMERVDFIVIGTGINVNYLSEEEFSPEVRDIATSLSILLGHKKISRLDFFADILKNFEELLQEVDKNGFKKILDEWRSLSLTLGQNVNVIGVAQHETFSGRALDIDEDGALLVQDEKDGKVKKVLAGDVSIRLEK